MTPIILASGLVYLPIYFNNNNKNSVLGACAAHAYLETPQDCESVIFVCVS